MAKDKTMLIVVVLVIAFFALGGTKLFQGSNTPATPTNPSSPNAPIATGQCSVIPTYSYSAVNAKAQGTAVGGTAYYKVNGLAASTTAATNPTPGVDLKYWMSNTTYFCNPVSTTGQCGANTVQDQCYQNGSLTIAMWDSDNSNAALTANGGATNLTMGALATQNAAIKYKADSLKANMPLGGCVAIEVPAHVMIQTVNGAGVIDSQPCPYVWTYNVQAATNTYRTFAVPNGFDAAGDGLIKTIDVQLKSDASNPAGLMYVTFAPANYYVANDGNIVLGIEKDKNQDTTKTFSGPAAAAFGIT